MSLVNKSLIRRDIESGRYEIHELLRQYAYERLQASTELDSTHAQYAAYFSNLVAQQLPLLKGQGQMEGLEHIKGEYDNCSNAWLWAVENKNETVINEMLESFFLFLAFHYWMEAGFELFGRVREIWPANSDDAPLIAGRLSVRFHIIPDFERYQATIEQAIAIAKNHQNSAEVSFCQRELGWLLGHTGQGQAVIEEGIDSFEASLQYYQEAGEQFYKARILDDIGWAYQRLNDENTRLKYSRQSIEMRKEVGDIIGHGRCLTGYIFRIWDDEPDDALQLIKDAYEFGLKERNYFLVVDAKILLGTFYFVKKNDIQQAKVIVEETLELASKINHGYVLRISQLVMASIICRQGGNLDEAYVLIQTALPAEGMLKAEYAYFINGSLAYIYYFASRGDFAQLSARLLPFLHLTEFSRDVDFASLTPVVAMMLYHDGQREKAVQLLSISFTIENVTGFVGQLKEWSALHKFEATLQQELGEIAYNAAWERGQSLDLAILKQEILAEFPHDTER